jgi:hypothetical protein
MNNADDFAKGLSEIAEEMLALSETPRKVAELAVPKIQALLEQEIASGVDPSGQTWEPLKNGSGRIPFSSPRHGKDAMKPTVRAVGTFVVAKIGGWANVHQNSKRASLPQRQGSSSREEGSLSRGSTRSRRPPRRPSKSSRPSSPRGAGSRRGRTVVLLGA